MEKIIRKQKLGKDKKGDMSLPFGLIFSIILIVVFIVIAFIAIKYFLNIGDCSKVGQFYDNLQQKVDSAWRSQLSEFEYDISVPSGVSKLCFANASAASLGNVTKADYTAIRRYSVYDANTFLLPSEKTCNMPYKQINHINLSAIIGTKNPYCIDVANKITIKKGVFDKLVTIQ